MATLTAKLTLTSSNVTSDALNIAKASTLTVLGDVVIRRIKLSTTASAALVAGDWTGSFVYLFNTEALGGASIKIVASEGGDTFITMGPQEWCFFPWESTVSMLADASSDTPTIEIGIFQRDA